MQTDEQTSLENVKIAYQTKSEPNNADNEKVADLSETHMRTDNQCEYYAAHRISPPPRKRSRKKQLLRKTNKDEQKADNQSASQLANDQQFDTTNQQNARSFNDSKIDQKNVCDQIEKLTLETNNTNNSEQSNAYSNRDLFSNITVNSDQLTCLQWTHKTDKSRNSHLMERIRLWKRRWFTSEEAKITRRRRLSRFFYFCRVFLTHLFSTTGLCLLVIVYSILGAIVFNELESGDEREQREISKINRKNCAKDLWNYTITLNVFKEDQWTEATDKRLEIFEKYVIEMVKRGKYDGNRWTFFSALLYSVTVITTIGYGNVTCQTAIGKIVTMIYALIGIPIMFLCLANLGNIMAKTFRFSYRRICCTCNCFSRPKPRAKRKSPVTANKESFELKNNLIEKPKEIKVNFDNNDEQKVVTSVVTSSTKLNSVSQTQHENACNAKQNSDMIVHEMMEEENDRVPAWLVLLLVIGYIMAGAVLFTIWENDWGLLNGAYFCFITLTTIGFGDLVPGFASNYNHTEEDKIKFTFCCIYMIVGLSLLAMSFNLVQEEIVIKSKQFAHKIGILPQNNQFDKNSHL